MGRRRTRGDRTGSRDGLDQEDEEQERGPDEPRERAFPTAYPPWEETHIGPMAARLDSAAGHRPAGRPRGAGAVPVIK